MSERCYRCSLEQKRLLEGEIGPYKSWGGWGFIYGPWMLRFYETESEQCERVMWGPSLVLLGF